MSVSQLFVKKEWRVLFVLVGGKGVKANSFDIDGMLFHHIQSDSFDARLMKYPEHRSVLHA